MITLPKEKAKKRAILEADETAEIYLEDTLMIAFCHICPDRQLARVCFLRGVTKKNGEFVPTGKPVEAVLANIPGPLIYPGTNVQLPEFNGWTLLLQKAGNKINNIMLKHVEEVVAEELPFLFD